MFHSPAFLFLPILLTFAIGGDRSFSRQRPDSDPCKSELKFSPAATQVGSSEVYKFLSIVMLYRAGKFSISSRTRETINAEVFYVSMKIQNHMQYIVSKLNGERIFQNNLSFSRVYLSGFSKRSVQVQLYCSKQQNVQQAVQTPATWSNEWHWHSMNRVPTQYTSYSPSHFTLTIYLKSILPQGSFPLGSFYLIDQDLIEEPFYLKPMPPCDTIPYRFKHCYSQIA